MIVTTFTCDGVVAGNFCDEKMEVPTTVAFASVAQLLYGHQWHVRLSWPYSRLEVRCPAHPFEEGKG